MLLKLLFLFALYCYMIFPKKDKENNDNIKQQPKKKKSILREWLDAAVFAIVAATLIRIFLFEAYTIPTASMEGSMLINDYLFVSKLSYGPRIPMTPIAIPLVHNTMPITGGKSYTEALHFDYHRLWGFGHIERYDVVVFNFPAGDTVALEVQNEKDYYSLLRENKFNREAVKGSYTILSRPVDKKENYIKRNIGLPGDVLEVRDAIVYVNGQKAPEFPHSKLWYLVKTKGQLLSDEFLDENLIENIENNGNSYILNIENDKVETVKNNPNIASITPYIFPKGSTFDWAYPQDTANFKWNRDNYGPLTIPKAGTTVSLTPQNIALYRRVIANYEHNKLEEKDGKILINDKEANSYTFKMDYYWMMGDNRDNSADSRYWGFVPIDHVVGKAWFVWFSYGKGGMFGDMRWRRMLRSIKALEK